MLALCAITMNCCQGIIIGTKILRESDLILSILTNNKGKISAIASGARRSQKRFMGGLELFDAGDFEFSTKSRSSGLNFRTESFSRKQIWTGLRERLDRFATANLCLEITNSLLPEENPEDGCLLELINKTLEAIHQCNSNRQIIVLLNFYCVAILQHIGLDPRFADQMGKTSSVNRELTTEMKKWWDEMTKARKPRTPYNTAILEDSVEILLNMIEETTNRKLLSRECYNTTC